MPGTKAYFYDVFFFRFFSISRFLKRKKAALCKLLLQEPQCSSKKKANGLTAGSGAAETSAVWLKQPFQKNKQMAWLI